MKNEITGTDKLQPGESQYAGAQPKIGDADAPHDAGAVGEGAAAAARAKMATPVQKLKPGQELYLYDGPERKVHAGGYSFKAGRAVLVNAKALTVANRAQFEEHKIHQVSESQAKKLAQK